MENDKGQFHGLMQGRCNSSALAKDLHISCIKPIDLVSGHRSDSWVIIIEGQNDCGCNQLRNGCIEWGNDSMRGNKTYHWLSVRLQCLVHPSVRDKRRVSEIDLSQPRHETAFWWHHNGPLTSQLTDPIKWPNYPLELIGTYVHINIHSKESLTQRCRRSTNVQMCLIFLYISIWFEGKWMACLISHHK